MSTQNSIEFKDYERNLTNLHYQQVRFSRLMTGEPGIAIGEEELWLSFKRCESGWKVRLYDLRGSIKPLTAWITINDAEKLRRSPNVETMREILKREYPETWKFIIEDVIGLSLIHI